METIKIRGLAVLASWIFGLWGLAVLIKGIFDLFLGGQPDANSYAPVPWGFVSKTQWARYAAFEAVYGLSCLGIARGLKRYSLFLPETLRRKRQEPELGLFS